ncbi:protein BUNDLE SHEATH DEFECTIVE 2, chloroplastic-like [Lotus japonicus]|uniref:BSD2 cysteine rich domain-containing protein n=1 Tax=Lotus japonicus TaxID=34305 RepID=I3SGK9_LOTJA|nr:protein BUNDLE SHEATH DEFECTIVE 2, chloroplastic-like [Lotus japonicus]AFK39401.1 unknown [Lotus japonicus]
MVPSLCLTPRSSPTLGHPQQLETHKKQKHCIRVNRLFQGPPTDKFSFLTAKAANGNQQNTKPNSVICADCDGNGAVVCSQCKGNGVNSVDIFNGQFKAGDSCWLCGGRKEMLCGNCNGAGFIGGFLSTYDQ